MASERLIREIEDRDFGHLGLWEDRSMGGPISGPTREIVLLTWRGKVGDVTLHVAAHDDSDDVLSGLDNASRAIVCGVPARQPELLVQAARGLLDVARDWSDNPSMTQEQVASALRLDIIDVHPGAECPLIALWLEDTADIFAGHGVLADLDANGDIDDVSLQG